MTFERSSPLSVRNSERYARFLTARKGDIVLCEEMIAADDVWRKENECKFAGEYILPEIIVSKPFPIVKLKLSLLTTLSPDVITWDVVRGLEYALTKAELHYEEAKVELHIDATDIGLTNINVGNIKTILQTFSDHYPERTHKITISGLSFVYHYIARTVIAFLDGRTAAKISIE